MVLEDVEETITTTDIDEETNEEITKVFEKFKKKLEKLLKILFFFIHLFSLQSISLSKENSKCCLLGEME